MARRQCCVCGHKHRGRIEALVIGGVSQNAVSKQFEVDRSQLCRHMKDHVSDADRTVLLAGTADLEKLRKIAVEQGASVLDDLQLLRGMTFRQLHDAATARDANRFALLAARMLDVLEAVGRRTGEIAQFGGITVNNTTNVSITTSPQFVRLQRGLMRLILNHPEIRADVAELLKECEGEERRGELIALEAPRDAAA